LVDEKNPNKKSIRINLAEVENPTEDIPSIRFFSTPSRKRYVRADQLKLVAGGQ
jgi:ribosomal protein S8